LIETYNEVHFHPKPPRTTNPIENLPSNSIDVEAFKPHNSLISQAPIISNITIPSTNNSNQPTWQAPFEQLGAPLAMDTTSLCNAIIISTDKLFFMQYTPAETMRPCWYLVQVNLISTAELNPQWKETGRHFCVFLARHPTDKDKSDEFARWWPDWYRYSTVVDARFHRLLQQA